MCEDDLRLLLLGQRRCFLGRTENNRQFTPGLERLDSERLRVWERNRIDDVFHESPGGTDDVRRKRRRRAVEHDGRAERSKIVGVAGRSRGNDAESG